MTATQRSRRRRAIGRARQAVDFAAATSGGAWSTVAAAARAVQRAGVALQRVVDDLGDVDGEVAFWGGALLQVQTHLGRLNTNNLPLVAWHGLVEPTPSESLGELAKDLLDDDGEV